MRHALRLFAIALALLSLSLRAPAQDAAAAGRPRVYDAQGKSVTFEQVLDAIAASDVVFVGEMHNDGAAHQLELQLLAGTYAHLARDAQQRNSARPLVLSLEMFERDVQLVLDEYLAGLIQEKQF